MTRHKRPENKLERLRVEKAKKAKLSKEHKSDRLRRIIQTRIKEQETEDERKTYLASRLQEEP